MPGTVREVCTNHSWDSKKGMAAPWASQKRFHEDRRLSGAFKVSEGGQSMSTKGRGVENLGSGILHRTNSDTLTKDRMEGWRSSE